MQTPVQKFTEALENWQEANREYHKAVDSCDRSPAYFCHRERERMEDATHQMQAAFEEAVTAAVQKAVEAR